MATLPIAEFVQLCVLDQENGHRFYLSVHRDENYMWVAATSIT